MTHTHTCMSIKSEDRGLTLDSKFCHISKAWHVQKSCLFPTAMKRSQRSRTTISNTHLFCSEFQLSARLHTVPSLSPETLVERPNHTTQLFPPACTFLWLLSEQVSELSTLRNPLAMITETLGKEKLQFSCGRNSETFSLLNALCEKWKDTKERKAKLG